MEAFEYSKSQNIINALGMVLLFIGTTTNCKPVLVLSIACFSVVIILTAVNGYKASKRNR